MRGAHKNLKEGNAMTSEVVDLGSCPSTADREMRRTNILIGAHGAGLMPCCSRKKLFCWRSTRPIG